MKTITIWAARNRKKAVLIIVMLHTILNLSGMYLGYLLYEENLVLNKGVFYGSLFVFIIVYFFYAVKSKKKTLFKFDVESKIFKYTFSRRFASDMIVAFTAFVMLVYLTDVSLSLKTLPVISSFKAKAADYKTNTQTKNTYSEYKVIHKTFNNKQLNVSKQNKHFLKKIKFRNKLKYKKTTSKFDWRFVLAVFSIVLLSLAATFALAVLSCGIACSGWEAAAITVAVVGLAGILLLSVYLFKKAIRKRELRLNINKYEES